MVHAMVQQLGGGGRQIPTVPGQPGVHNEPRLHSETLDKTQNQNKETKRSWHRGYVSGLRHTASAWQTQGTE